MVEEKIDLLMQKLSQNQQEMDAKLTSAIAEVKREVTSAQLAQERTAQELSRKISGPAYQFRKKGNEMQFKFNQEVEESIASAKKELEKMAPSDTGERATLSRATELLEEGASALKTRQKHIKVADRSRFGWGTVRHYQSDPLADNEDDEKQLRRSEKEAEHEFREFEEASKRRRGGGRGGWRWRPYPYAFWDPQWDTPGPSSRTGTAPTPPQPLMSLTPQRQIRPKVLGPCFTCGAFGHLAASFPLKGKQYPFGQPVVSSAEVTSVISEYSELSMCVQGVDSGTAESCVPLQCVNDSQSMVDVWDTSEVVDTYPSDGLLVDTARIWEAEVSPTLNQISDVQGRLKQKIQFWQEILHAPPLPSWTV